MNIVKTPLVDLLVVEPKVFGDQRGWFVETYNAEKFAAAGISTVFVQDNHSSSSQGVLRGLHFQRPPYTQAKLVRCTRGRLWDVAVDVRPQSATYGQWFGLELSAENKKMLYIPEGFAHGFYALEECELVYKCSQTYHPEVDGGVIWNDSDIAIQWPLIEGVEVTISPKDAALPRLSDLQNPF